MSCSSASRRWLPVPPSLRHQPPNAAQPLPTRTRRASARSRRTSTCLSLGSTLLGPCSSPLSVTPPLLSPAKQNIYHLPFEYLHVYLFLCVFYFSDDDFWLSTVCFLLLIYVPVGCNVIV